MLDQIRFLLIFFIMALSFSYGNYARNKHDVYLLRAAMLLTLTADFCMLILGENEIGVLIFCLVQIIYNLRYTNLKRTAGLLAVLFSISCIVIQLAIWGLLEKLSILYAVCFTFSLFGAAKSFKAYCFPNNYLMVLGMTLFMLCDINVLLYNIDTFASTRWIFSNLIWVFYLPSQILLALSGKKMYE